MSQLFPETKREDPKDAEVPSHRVLVRAGYVRRVAAGMYTMLPLGLRVQRKIEEVVRQEMDAIGAQEVRFPALLPRAPYEKTNRWDEYGDNIFRLQDRRKNDMLLGPTHEEMFTITMADEVNSWRSFPKSLYQIGLKYRDEARPRSGILRGREFIMKDSYSFDLDDAGLEQSYLAHRNAYQKIFGRLGIDYRIVKALSGAMGGSASEEFIAPSPIGEDTFVSCPNCDFVSNVEAIDFVAPKDVSKPSGAATKLSTPKAGTIDELVASTAALERSISATDTLKVVLFRTDTEPVLVAVPGDREVSEDKLLTFLGSKRVTPFTDTDFAKYPTLVKGYTSPAAATAVGIRVIADHRVIADKGWVVGGDQADHHTFDAVVGRDFNVSEYAEVTNGAIGDPCPNCGATLEGERGIEIGHVFQLGRKYTDAFQWDVLGQNGEKIRPTMGSYGIGVTRAVAVVAEQTLDDKGLCWPAEISPYDVHILASGADQLGIAESIVAELEQHGLTAILDDRDRASFGVKVKDAELIGVPKIVIVGRDAANGQVEVRDRKSGEATVVAIADVLASIR